MTEQATVFGDYGYTSEEVLYEGDIDECIRWARRYVQDGDFGGYGKIEVATFAEDGEYLTHWAATADED